VVVEQTDLRHCCATELKSVEQSRPMVHAGGGYDGRLVVSSR
jgi:hypothetical protein